MLLTIDVYSQDKGSFLISRSSFLLHRCIFKELTLNFLLCVVALLTLILIGRGLQLRELFLNLNLGILDVFILISFMMPMFLILVLPISCMLSIFLTFLRMSTDRELIALKAGGVSLYQMVLAPLLFSIFCMFFALFISLHGISWGMTSFRSSILDYANTKAKIVLQPGIFNQNLFGKTIFARKVDPISGKLEQVIFEDTLQNGKSVVTFLAPQGEIVTDEAAGQLKFILNNGHMYQVGDGKVSMLNFENYTATLDLSKLLSGVELDELRPKEMSWQALLRLASRNLEQKQRFDYKVVLEIHKRLALPLACLVLGMFAMPVACSFEGGKRHHGIILALLMFLVYYSIFSLGMSVGETGKVPPAIAIWIPNGLFALAALAGLYVSNKEQMPSAATWISTLHEKITARKRRVTP